MFIGFHNVCFGNSVTALGVLTHSADDYSVRQVELWKCTFEEISEHTIVIQLLLLSELSFGM